MNSTFKDKVENFSLILPALVIFSLFYIYPFFYSFILSLTDYNIIGDFNFKAHYFTILYSVLISVSIRLISTRQTPKATDAAKSKRQSTIISSKFNPHIFFIIPQQFYL